MKNVSFLFLIFSSCKSERTRLHPGPVLPPTRWWNPIVAIVPSTSQSWAKYANLSAITKPPPLGKLVAAFSPLVSYSLMTLSTALTKSFVFRARNDDDVNKSLNFWLRQRFLLDPSFIFLLLLSRKCWVTSPFLKWLTAANLELITSKFLCPFEPRPSASNKKLVFVWNGSTPPLSFKGSSSYIWDATQHILTQE